MGGHADVSKQKTVYLFVFGALAVGTVLTVLAAQIEASTPVHITIALAIAVVKASLVAAIFMHLKWETSSSIWIALLFCAIFFVVLLLLPVLTMQDMNRIGVEHSIWG